MNKKVNIAILGATGVVGETLLQILEERQFPIDKLYLLASERSAGTTLTFKKKSFTIVDSAHFDFSQAQICFAAVDNATAKAMAPQITRSGCIMIDKSAQFRYESDVPLVVPEVNPEAIANYHLRQIIATPNCSTIPLMVALKPIHETVGIARMNVVTYQSVSGSGKQGIAELSQQVQSIWQGQPIERHCYPTQIAFNVIPHIDSFLESGYTKEEMKIVWESQKILSDNTIAINPTAVRVPVFYGHSAAVHLEMREKLPLAHIKELLSAAPGVTLMTNDHYPTPVDVANCPDAVYVGRLRADISHPCGLNLWIVADNVRKGAALNAIQIAEILVKDYL